ncbi:MAG: 2,3-bisphosphoglycerate-independent phosphoglycerate mutase [Patescibacteria group bacterium]
MKKTVVLMILDGWGIGRDDESNPIHVVNPQALKWIEENYPVTSLQASGISVGLPWGEVGNSEVGHLTIGAGKVIYQYYPRIVMSIADGTFFKNETLRKVCDHAKKNNSSINFVGLLTKGNVHASLEHLHALIKLAKEEGVSRVKLHLFADGKDMPPHTVQELLATLPQEMIATVTGRYYAMDREGNWDLIKEAYNCLVSGGGMMAKENFAAILEKNYSRGLTEEFLPALRFGGPEMNIEENDALFFFDFREDSIREIAESFIAKEFDKFPRKNFSNLFIATMTRYKETFSVPVAFASENVKLPLGKILAERGMTQLRLAESYKYAHITYFFNGYDETPYKNEYRVLIPSESIPHPDEHPAMMAPAITDRLLQAIQDQAFDFILVNYANPDTIGHTGNYDAAQEAVRVIDAQIGKVLQAAVHPDITLLITSDHGNLEEVINPMTGRAETQHDPNPVPLYLIGDRFRGKRFSNQGNLARETAGILSDIAPTILDIMSIPKPEDMTGESLIKNIQ